MSRALRDGAGRVVGACDEGLPFDVLGRRPWRPQSRPAPRVRVAAADINVEIDTTQTADLAALIPGYGRLR
jgi:hypothetical protein